MRLDGRYAFKLVVRGDAREVLSWEELPQAPATLPLLPPPPRLGKSCAPGSGGSGAASSYSSSAQLRLAVLPDAADPGLWPVNTTQTQPTGVVLRMWCLQRFDTSRAAEVVSWHAANPCCGDGEHI